MTQPMQIQGAVIPACEPESMKGVDAGCVKAGSLGMYGMTQRGFSLVSAIFLLVVIAMLGTFAVTLSTTQQQSSALDVLGSRAYQASRAGIEWGAYQVIRNPAGISCPLSGASNPVAMPAAPSTLSGFTVDVSCWSYAPVSEAASTVTMYQLTSTATQGTVATPSYVERQMTVTIAQ